MLKEGKFGPQEAISMVSISISANVLASDPSVLINDVGNTGWYMSLISALIALAGFVFIYMLLKRFNGKNLMEIFDLTLGKYIGFVFSAFLAVYMLIYASISLREFTEVAKIYNFEMTPPAFIMGLLIISIVIVSFLGLETLARLSKLGIYIILVSLAAVLLLVSNDYKLYRIFPLLGKGIYETLSHGVIRSGVFCHIIIFGVVAKSLQGAKYIKKAGFISLMISTTVITITYLAFILTFAYGVAGETTSPIYALTRVISRGRFFQRLDPFFLFVWHLSSLILITVSFYFFTNICCKMFRLSDMRPIIMPSAFIMFALAMIPENFSVLAFNYNHRFKEIGWIIYLLAPAALLAAVIRKKRGQNTNA